MDGLCGVKINERDKYVFCQLFANFLLFYRQQIETIVYLQHLTQSIDVEAQMEEKITMVKEIIWNKEKNKYTYVTRADL